VPASVPFRDVSKPLLQPYAPVLAEEPEAQDLETGYGSQSKNVLFERCVLREATISAVKSERVELRGCDLTGLRGAEALRGMRMPWNDVLENAPLFSGVVGIEIVD
jgi:hypothetical protein